MIRLKTKRLIIRDPLPTDIEEWHRLLSDPKAMYYLPEIMTRSLDESKENLQTAIAESQNQNRTRYFFAIEHGVTGKFLGTAGYTVTETTPLGKFAGVGYFILPEYHGLGYMPEALSEIIRFAFEDNGVYRISTGCLTENRPSERVMQKCGFIKESERKHFTWHDGHMKDRVEYRLLKEEWKSVQKMQNYGFWQAFDTLIAGSDIIIDRPKGSAHPHYPNFIYPLDYGYLKNTTSMDGGGIDIWVGSNSIRKFDAIMCIIDLTKRDSEIKLLLGCTKEEKMQVYQVHNQTTAMKGILIQR